MLTAIDLFAGAGGLSAGLVQAGFDVRAAVEFDPTSAETYALNHPTTSLIVDDVRRVTGPRLLTEAGMEHGDLDILTGCPPCQGFSTLRTRRRSSQRDDERNELIFQVLRLTRSLRPRALLVENVPGLAVDERFKSFVTGIEGAGYSLMHSTLDATQFGVPQRRKRLVLVAVRRGVPRPEWFKHEENRATVRQTIGYLPPAGNSGDPLHDLPERRSARIMERIAATPVDGGSRRDIPGQFDLPCHTRSDGFSDVYGRMAWDDVAPTITSGCHNPSKGRFLHPQENRAITLREAALLQTFPQNYQFSLSRGKEHAARQIGNAFPPKLILSIAAKMRSEFCS